MQSNNIINEKWIILKYKINKNKFILDFKFFLHKQNLYWKRISLRLSFVTETALSTSITHIGPSTYPNYFTYKKDFIVNWYAKRLIIDLKKFGSDVEKSSYVDFDINLILIIDDSIFFDTTIYKETDVKKIWINYLYN